jgi:hypothetical protein
MSTFLASNKAQSSQICEGDKYPTIGVVLTALSICISSMRPTTACSVVKDSSTVTAIYISVSNRDYIFKFSLVHRRTYETIRILTEFQDRRPPPLPVQNLFSKHVFSDILVSENTCFEM